MTYLRKSLLLLFFLCIFTYDSTAKEASVEIMEITFCGDSNHTCDRSIDIIEIDSHFFDIFVTSGAKNESTTGGSRAFFDSLFNYANKTQSIAVFSGGFIRDLIPLTPLGGLKIDGNTISSLSRNWMDSSIVCTKDGKLSVFRDFSKFHTEDNCLQSGPTIIDGDRSEEDLKRDLGRNWPVDFWNKLTRRVIIAVLENGNAMFIVAHNHSFSEAYAFLKSSKFNKRIQIAVGLNGGPWSGYIVRTPDKPRIIGDIDFVFPSVFLVKRVETPSSTKLSQ
jgi:hypothetical protein